MISVCCVDQLRKPSRIRPFRFVSADGCLATNKSFEFFRLLENSKGFNGHDLVKTFFECCYLKPN